MSKAGLFVSIGLIMYSGYADAQIACRAPESFAEVVICEEGEFKTLHDALDKKIEEIRKYSTDEEKEIFDTEVINWEKNTRDTCKDSICLKAVYENYIAILEKKRAAVESEVDPVTRMRITSDEVKAREEALKGKYMPFMIGYDEDGKLNKMAFIGNRMRKAACKRHVQKKTTEISYRLHSWPLRGSFFQVNGDYLNLICVQGEFLDARALIQMEYLSMATDPTWASDSDSNPPIKKIRETQEIWDNLTDDEMDNYR